MNEEYICTVAEKDGGHGGQDGAGKSEPDVSLLPWRRDTVREAIFMLFCHCYLWLLEITYRAHTALGSGYC